MGGGESFVISIGCKYGNCRATVGIVSQRVGHPLRNPSGLVDEYREMDPLDLIWRSHFLGINNPLQRWARCFSLYIVIVVTAALLFLAIRIFK